MNRGPEFLPEVPTAVEGVLGVGGTDQENACFGPKMVVAFGIALDALVCGSS